MLLSLNLARFVKGLPVEAFIRLGISSAHKACKNMVETFGSMFEAEVVL